MKRRNDKRMIHVPNKADISATKKKKILTRRDSDKYEDLYEYNDEGHITYHKQTRGDMILRERWNTYNDKGNRVYSKISALRINWDIYPTNRTIITTEYFYIYDENNNTVYAKNSKGHERWQDFDKNNNMIHAKESNGHEWWYEYDEEGNITYCKKWTGYEEWYEYI